jgi:Protein of unknown function (DUF1501)
MLSIPGNRHGYCDGISRRDFLRIGVMGIGGLTLADLLRLEAQAGTAATGRSVINIYLSGGPTHMDTFDLKPNAPREFRGELTPIATKVSGIDICELFPRLASCTDQCVIVRSVAGMNNEHNPSQSNSGWPVRSLDNLGGRPGIGPVMSKVFGPAQQTPDGAAPTAVDLTGWTRPGFLGQVHSAYRPDGNGRQNLTLNRIDEDRFLARQDLLGGLDRMRRDVDASGMMDAMDSFSQRAVGIITSGRVAQALDIRDEPPENLERYGAQRDRNNQNFILARRLIEADVRNVALSVGGWDTHNDNFRAMRIKLPQLDTALSALIEDLNNSGRLQDTIILMSGEFGRTPRINGRSGRDHWPQAASFFIAGGGLRTGQVVGATNRLGERPQDRPVHLQQVFATVYHQLGIDVETTQLIDPNGRPQYLLEHREVIHELV